MRRFLWQRGLTSLALMLACAAGLCALSNDSLDTVRAFTRDVAGPGARAVAKSRAAIEYWSARAWQGLQPAVASLASSTTSTVDATRVNELEARLAAAESQQRRLQVQLATTHEELLNLQRERERVWTEHRSDPLLRPRLVMAQVLGTDRRTLNGLADRLLDAGGVQGISRDDFVIDMTATSTTGDESPVMLIDQGETVELAADLPVIAGGCLVGRIRSCGRLTSTVQRVTDPEFRVGARIIRQTADQPVFGAEGVFAGGGAGSEPASGRLELVPAVEPVTVGDRVYMHEVVAGREASFYIGEVVRAEVLRGDPHWTIAVQVACPTPPARVGILKSELNPARLALGQASTIRSHAAGSSQAESGPAAAGGP